MSSSVPVMEQYKALILKELDVIDSKLLVNDYVQVVHSKVPKARPVYLAAGAGLFVFAFLVWGVGARFVANLVGFAYPLYESFRSLNDGQADDQDSQWLTYWIVYAVFTLVESLTDFLANWIPLYHLVKIAFLTWCFLPHTRGALVIYRLVIEPLLVRYESRIDAVSSKGRAAANRIAADVEEEVSTEVSMINRRIVDNALGNLTSSMRSGYHAAPTSSHHVESAETAHSHGDQAPGEEPKKEE